MFLKIWSGSLWLYVLLLLGLGVLLSLYSHWQSWSEAQKLVAFIYVLLPLHAWEEWRIPGGFGYQYNWVMGHSDQPDRYPMNQLSDMVTVLGAMLLGMALLSRGVTGGVLLSQTLFALSEVGMHLFFGVKILAKFREQGKRSLYNPGFATAMLGFLPLLIWGLTQLAHTHLTGRDGLATVGLMLLLATITFLPERLLGRRDNPYPFAPGYYARFLVVSQRE